MWYVPTSLLINAAMTAFLVFLASNLAIKSGNAFVPVIPYLCQAFLKYSTQSVSE